MKKKFGVLIFTYGFLINLTGQPDPCGTEGHINGVLNYNETKEYVSNYIDFHSLPRSTYTRSYYINSKTFKFFGDFFAANHEYIGLNFYFIIYKSKPNSEQAKMEQSLLYCVPVTERNVDGVTKRIADFNAFQTFYDTWPDRTTISQKVLRSGIVCPNNCDSTIMSWDVEGHTFPRLRNESPDPSNSDRVIFSSEDIVDSRRKRHIEFRKYDWSGKETKYVFIGRGSMLRLSRFIELYPSTPLVGIYYGSYNDIKPETYQLHPKQTTIIIIPMIKDDRGYIEPNICGYIRYISDLKLDKIKRPDTENHGSLCPNYCPTD